MNQPDFRQSLPDLVNHPTRFDLCENTDLELIQALDTYFSYDSMSDNLFNCHKEEFLEAHAPGFEGSVWYGNAGKSQGVLVVPS